MGETPSAATVQGQDVLQGQLALPTGARREAGRARRAGLRGQQRPLAFAHWPSPVPQQTAAAYLPACLRATADPREQGGHYWGYITRIAPGLAALRDGCPFPGGYDLVVGTSGARRWGGEHGVAVGGWGSTLGVGLRWEQKVRAWPAVCEPG